MRIYLVGFMGSGKSEVGKRLAGLLGVPFVDLDGEVEVRAGSSVEEIFRREGEAAFRRREGEALRATADAAAAVVATGGGILTCRENRRWLAANGLSVWLNPPLATLLARLGPAERARRPLFRSEGQAARLWRRRLAGYRACDLEIAVGPDETADETAERIARALAERTCAT